ncbi:MAG TPA: hypothetical protein VGL93_06135 [Streptosporangiaceae bacterium]|jgi:hypothetical protein
MAERDGRLIEVPGVWLDLDAYSDAYDDAYENIVFRKLERRQHYREPGVPSWEAFATGDWARAIELNERERGAVADKVAEDARLGVESRRVRIVEKPITAYIQWEMQYFRLLAEAGESIRVVDADQVRRWESAGPVPEMVVLGDRVLFEVVYDAAGTATGARRVDDPAVIRAAAAEIEELHAGGESLLEFYRREIATLPPPTV